MIIFKRSQTDTAYIYQQKSILLPSLVAVISITLFLIFPPHFPFGQSSSQWNVSDFWFTILAIFLIIDIGGMWINYAKANSAGKKITQSGNMWSGNLKYEIEK